MKISRLTYRVALAAGVVGIAIAAARPAEAQVRSLNDALALTYATNPALLAARAQLRAIDENVPQALAGWRPQVSISANAGYIDGTTQQYIRPTTFTRGRTVESNALRGSNTESITLTQPLFRGGATRANTNRAENQVMAQRAALIGSEQTAFSSAVNAYVSVIQANQVLALSINNEQVLNRQLQATRERFRVGEITRTDVAQAEAAFAGATANRQSAEGDLQTARSAFLQVIGEPASDRLAEPQPLRLPMRTIDEARALAASNNPAVIAALFNDAAARDNFDIQYSKLMPNLSLQGSLSRNEDVQQKDLTTKVGQVLMVLSIPLYQGGGEYAAIRQARQQQLQTRQQVDDARRQAIQQVTQAWNTYVAARATIGSTREQIRSNEIALEGVQREAIVGSRTTLDVLNAEQTLLNSRVTLVRNLGSLINASYTVAAAAGRLTARDLNLNVPLYDETAYYKAVRNRLIGTGDYATEQPGR
ncbi:MAG: TolC family outer membrane protein [Acetobacteraceae bacterium]|nr:TolC family outer membrane protein [Acetobacteraceae bacterium]